MLEAGNPDAKFVGLGILTNMSIDSVERKMEIITCPGVANLMYFVEENHKNFFFFLSFFLRIAGTLSTSFETRQCGHANSHVLLTHITGRGAIRWVIILRLC